MKQVFIELQLVMSVEVHERGLGFQGLSVA